MQINWKLYGKPLRFVVDVNNLMTDDSKYCKGNSHSYTCICTSCEQLRVHANSPDMHSKKLPSSWNICMSVDAYCWTRQKFHKLCSLFVAYWKGKEQVCMCKHACFLNNMCALSYSNWKLLYLSNSWKWTCVEDCFSQIRSQIQYITHWWFCYI